MEDASDEAYIDWRSPMSSEERYKTTIRWLSKYTSHNHRVALHLVNVYARTERFPDIRCELYFSFLREFFELGYAIRHRYGRFRWYPCFARKIYVHFDEQRSDENRYRELSVSDECIDAVYDYTPLPCELIEIILRYGIWKYVRRQLRAVPQKMNLQQ